MKQFGRVLWLLAALICLTEAMYKMRRPLPPPGQPMPQFFKKSRPIAHRMSMGNTIHIGPNYGPKRPLYKPNNYRIRRPSMYNVLPNAWKNPVPIMGIMNNHAALPQRPPIKEFHAMNKVPEYSPEYRPESAVMPPTPRGGMDDDKGAIHTIPAPNLSLADKPYNLVDGTAGDNSHEDQVSRHQYQNDGQYNVNHPVTNYGFGTLGTSPPPQRTMTSPVPTQNLYEVTETNEIGPRDYQTIQPTFFTPELDVSRLATSPNLDLQTNELYINHPGVMNPLKNGLIGTNIQFGQSNTPMQTNLHSSLHVGFPGSAAQAPSSLDQQIPDLHVGHPAPAGPPLAASQLYDLLNSFPQQINDQYANGQQPQLQQQILRQQLGQLFQPTGGVTSFSQPQMHSFNYDEQANKQLQQQHQQQQQQILVGQNYGAGRVTADYNLESEATENIQSPNVQVDNANGEEIGYRGAEASDQAENHIEYDQSGNGKVPSAFLNKVADADGISTQFYTTLPNKEAAEKLAALAAAGNVNSHLIGQLRKKQQEKLEAQQDIQQSDEPMPSNHKVNEYEVTEQLEDDLAFEAQQFSDDQQEQYDQQQQRYDEQQQLFDQQQYNRQQYQQQQEIRQQQELNDRYEQQRLAQQRQEESQDEKPEANKSRPMRIMVPDVEDYTEENQRIPAETENTSEDYDYDSPETEVTHPRTTASSGSTRTHDASSEFGTRITSKKGQ